MKPSPIQISRTSRGRTRKLLSVLSMTLLLGLAACSSAPLEPVKVVPIQVEVPSLPLLPRPDPVSLHNYRWHVITPDRLPEGGDWVIFGVTPRDWEGLARDVQDSIRWADEITLRLEFYERNRPEPEAVRD